MRSIFRPIAVVALAVAAAVFAEARTGGPAAAIGYGGALTCVLDVKDLSKSIDWYRDVLGFDLLYRMDDSGWAEMSTPVGRVNVGIASQRKTARPGGAGAAATLVFSVKDAEAARKALESRGVTFVGGIETFKDFVRLQTFLDPDGNHVMLYQDLRTQ